MKIACARLFGAGDLVLPVDQAVLHDLLVQEAVGQQSAMVLAQLSACMAAIRSASRASAWRKIGESDMEFWRGRAGGAARAFDRAAQRASLHP